MPFPGSPSATWIVLPLIALLLIWRLWRARAERRLRVEWLWMTPALLLIIAALVLRQTPLSGPEWLWMPPAFAAGAALGFWRGRLTTVTVDPQSHALTSRTSPAGLYLLVGVLVLRVALRPVFVAESADWHVSPAVLTDAFVLFAVGLVAVQRLEIWWRATRLLAEARAAARAD